MNFSNGDAQRPHVLIIHEVEDYEKWKAVFDDAAAIRREAGEIAYQLLAYDTDDGAHGALRATVCGFRIRSRCGNRSLCRCGQEGSIPCPRTSVWAARSMTAGLPGSCPGIRDDDQVCGCAQFYVCCI